MISHLWSWRGLALLVVMIASFVAAGPASAAPPTPTLITAPVKIPGGVPVVTVIGSQPLAISTNGLGGPGQLPVKADPTLVSVTDTVWGRLPRGISATGMSVQNQPPECEDYAAHGWRYDINGSKTIEFVQGKNPGLAVWNDSDSNQQYSVSSTSGGSLSVGAEAGVEVQASVIVASVKGKFGVNAQAQVSWSYTHTATITAGPRKRVVASFGVSRVVTTGHYYFINKYCEKSIDKGIVKTMTPYVFTLYVKQT